MNGRTIKIGLHVIIWIIFLILPLLILPEVFERFSRESCNRSNYLLISLLLVLLYYFNYYFAIPRYYFNQKYFSFIGVNIAFLIGVFQIIILKSLVFGICPNPELTPSFRNMVKLILPRHLLVFIFALIKALNDRLKAIDVQKTKSDLQLLRAQINPHFLFNVLNTIYGQAITKSDHTADSIEKLAGLMRYSLKEANVPKVTLAKEIVYLERYISLQKLRLTDKTQIDFQIKGNVDTVEISPMLLIPFVENAFKYGVSNEVDTTIKIVIEVVEKDIHLLVDNTKLPTKTIIEASNQIGINNVRSRLDLIYGNRHTLTINDSDTHYKVQLKIST